jgi:hypothetical protein
MEEREAHEATSRRSREQRKIGTEKFVVRVFREKVIDAAIKAGTLKGVLDDFLRTVLTSKDADSTDKKYARTTYQDAIVRIGGTGLPEWAREDAVVSPAPVEAAPPVPAPIDSAGPSKPSLNTPNPGLQWLPVTDSTPTRFLGKSDEELVDELAASPEIIPGPRPSDSHVYISDEEFYDLINEAEHDEFAQFSEHPFMRSEGPLWTIMRESYAPKMSHPFLETFEFQGARYVAIGSAHGTIPSGTLKGRSININFTIVPYRSIRDIPESMIVRDKGNVLFISYENPVNPGIKKCLYVLPHRAGRKIRFWTRIDEKDTNNGKRFVVLDDGVCGYHEVDRKDF